MKSPFKDVLLLDGMNKSDCNIHCKRRKSTEMFNVVTDEKLFEVK